MKETYRITGMSCQACAVRVQKAVSNIEGVSDANVNLLTEKMSVTYDEKLVNAGNIVDSITKAGYGAESIENTENIENTESNKPDASDELLSCFIWSLILLIPLMAASMIGMHTDYTRVCMIIQIALLIPVLIINRRFFIKGYKALFHLSPNMDSLVAVGATAATLYGYYESSAMILTLVTLGKYFESKSKKKTKEALIKLRKLAPSEAIVYTDNGEEKRNTKDIIPGDIIIVKPGMSIAADGEVIEGEAAIDESAITGESMPVHKKVKDKVVAATINKNGYLKIKVEKVGEETTISRIIGFVEEANSTKIPIARVADKVSGIFVPIVMLIALCTGIAWILYGESYGFAISSAVAVLVISCPCALGLATPVAIMVGTGVGARKGILVKSGEAIEVLHSVDTVVCDKTGTITEGKMYVTTVIAYGNKDIYSIIRIAAALEAKSSHPLAEAIINKAMELHEASKSGNDINTLEASDVNYEFSKGLTGRVNGNTYYIGSRNISGDMYSYNNDTVIDEDYDNISASGATPLIVCENSRENIIGIIGVADRIKEDSEEAIAELMSMGINVTMLTGDNKITALAIANQAGIAESNVYAEVMPDEKERVVKELMDNGHKIAMVGDGINDAPALVRANVGIAIGAGTDIAIDSADIILLGSRMQDVVQSIMLSRAVIRNIKENLFWAFFYNMLGIPLAAGALYIPFGFKLSPMIGAAAMSLSSVCVVTNALRLRKYDGGYKMLVNESNKGDKERDEIIMYIDGMSCNHCKMGVEKIINAHDGVSGEVDLQNKCAHIKIESEKYDEASKKALLDEIASTINENGWTVTKYE